jgi:hypothetical protein
MATSSTDTRDTSSSLVIARKTIEKREQMYEYYHPVINKSNEAMLDMIRDVGCTIRLFSLHPPPPNTVNSIHVKTTAVSGILGRASIRARWGRT